MRIRERKQKDMKYAVIYESVTGNTEMLAKELKSTLGEEKCVCFGIIIGWLETGMQEGIQTRFQRIYELKQGDLERLIARCEKEK